MRGPADDAPVNLEGRKKTVREQAGRYKRPASVSGWRITGLAALASKKDARAQLAYLAEASPQQLLAAGATHGEKRPAAAGPLSRALV